MKGGCFRELPRTNNWNKSDPDNFECGVGSLTPAAAKKAFSVLMSGAKSSAVVSVIGVANMVSALVIVSEEPRGNAHLDTFTCLRDSSAPASGW